jgi:hypothetical protein
MSMWNHRIYLSSRLTGRRLRRPAREGDRKHPDKRDGRRYGSAASKKQPTFEQLSLANIFVLHWRGDPAGDRGV